jgi:hypothetical protein
MAIQTLRPNATVSGAGNFTLTGGAGSAHATLNDNSDATFLANATSGVATLVLDNGTYTATSTDTFRRVRVRARVLSPTVEGRVNINLGARQAGVVKYLAALSIRGQYASITTLTGAWLSVSPFGSAWTQDDIDSIRVQITEYETGANDTNIYEIYVDADIATQPITSVTSPTGTVTDTAKPEVAFTYTDPDATDEQAFYQVKIFTAAQYGIVGFDPSNSPDSYDSGTVSSTDQTHAITSYLDNATYRAYARVGKSLGGATFWSEWAFSGFVLNVTRPTAPTLTSSWSEGNSRATLTVTGTAVVGFDYQYFELERSVDGGTTYETVRGGDELYPDVSFAASAYDYEVKRGITAKYRARSIGITGTASANSAYSTVSNLAITSDSKFWLKAVSTPALNYGAATVLNRLGITVEENLGVYRPIGRTLPIVVSGTISGSDGQLEIVTTTSAAWDAVYALSVYQYTVLLQEPTNDQKYVRFISRDWEEQLVGAIKQRILRINYVQVNADE